MVRDMLTRYLKQLVSVMLRTEGIGGRVGQTEDEGLAARERNGLRHSNSNKILKCCGS
jgi:hypothetical protein